MRTLSVFSFVLVLAPAIALAQTPQTYSLTQKMAGGMTVQVARDGAKESVEQTVAPSANGPGMHVRSLYDFTAKKATLPTGDSFSTPRSCAVWSTARWSGSWLSTSLGPRTRRT